MNLTEQKSEMFGRIAQVFSAYECGTTSDTNPFVSGVNSFQLVYENAAWRIVSLVWDRVK